MKKIQTYLATALAALTMTATADSLQQKVGFVDVGITNNDSARARVVENCEYTTKSGFKVEVDTLNQIQVDGNGFDSDSYYGINSVAIGHENIPFDVLAETTWNKEGSFQELFGLRINAPLADYGNLELKTDGDKLGISYFGGFVGSLGRIELLHSSILEQGKLPVHYAEIYGRKEIATDLDVFGGVEIPGGAKALVANSSNTLHDSLIKVGISYKF